jgi:hypothetical protein
MLMKFVISYTSHPYVLLILVFLYAEHKLYIPILHANLGPYTFL